MPLTGLLSQLLPLMAAASLGLLAGALLAEDRLLLPYARTLSVDAFYALHPSIGPRLYHFFAPLTVAAPMAAVLAAIQIALQSEGLGLRTTAAITAAVLAWSLVAIYMVYFRSANDAFTRHAVSPEDLPAELARWAGWHRARVLICLTAFALSLVALAA